MGTQKLRKQRAKIFETHGRQFDVVRSKALQKQKLLSSKVEALDHKFSQQGLDGQRHLSAQQKEIERREREQSLAVFRKKFEGVRGLTYSTSTSGRFRALDAANPRRTTPRNPGRKTKPLALTKLRRGSLSR